MDAVVQRIEFFHIAPHPSTAFLDRHLITRDALAWDVGDMVRVMEKGDCVVIGAEQQDLAIELQKPIER